MKFIYSFIIDSLARFYVENDNKKEVADNGKISEGIVAGWGKADCVGQNVIFDFSGGHDFDFHVEYNRIYNQNNWFIGLNRTWKLIGTHEYKNIIDEINSEFIVLLTHAAQSFYDSTSRGCTYKSEVDLFNLESKHTMNSEYLIIARTAKLWETWRHTLPNQILEERRQK